MNNGLCWVSTLAYPNLLGIKRLCWCWCWCSCIVSPQQTLYLLSRWCAPWRNPWALLFVLCHIPSSKATLPNPFESYLRIASAICHVVLPIRTHTCAYGRTLTRTVSRNIPGPHIYTANLVALSFSLRIKRLTQGCNPSESWLFKLAQLLFGTYLATKAHVWYSNRGPNIIGHVTSLSHLVL
jgi:hypothetical protein